MGTRITSLGCASVSFLSLSLSLSLSLPPFLLLVSFAKMFDGTDHVLAYQSHNLTTAASMPLPQCIQEIRVELASESGLRSQDLQGPDRTYRIYEGMRPSERDLGTIGDHIMVFSRGGRGEDAKVFALLNDMDIPEAVYKKWDAAMKKGDIERAKDAILSYIEFKGVLQTAMASDAIFFGQGFPRRPNGSAVISGIYGIYNPGMEPIDPMEPVVIDLPDFESPQTDSPTDLRFGYGCVRPRLIGYNPSNDYHHKRVIGVCVDGFNPNDGPVIRVRIGVP